MGTETNAGYEGPDQKKREGLANISRTQSQRNWLTRVRTVAEVCAMDKEPTVKLTLIMNQDLWRHGILHCSMSELIGMD